MDGVVHVSVRASGCQKIASRGDEARLHGKR